MSILDSIRSIGQGHTAANELLKQGETSNTVTDQSLFNLADRLQVADTEQFVISCRNELDLEAELEAMPAAWYEKLKFW